MRETKAATTRDNLKREYATEEIVVEWEPRLCFHSQNCVRSLPKVFDESRRPWVAVDAATADEVEAAVALCPSGALRTRRPRAHKATRATRRARASRSTAWPCAPAGGMSVERQIGRAHV